MVLRKFSMEGDEDKEEQKKLSPQQAILKMARYCAYQERSQHEVRQKLYELGLRYQDVEASISELISEGFINEERFAIAYAGGKFRMKHWGKVKIKAGLSLHKISEYCVKKALNSLNDEDYIKTIDLLLEKKIIQIKNRKSIEQQHLCAKYLISKGYESDLVWDRIKIIL
jgi:regulatory protein